jgi:hypothetical protein
MGLLRATAEVLVFSLVTFAAAFAARFLFFWDIKPAQGFGDDPPPSNAVEAAFLLLSIENTAVVVAAIALVSMLALLAQRIHNRRAKKP